MLPRREGFKLQAVVDFKRNDNIVVNVLLRIARKHWANHFDNSLCRKQWRRILNSSPIWTRMKTKPVFWFQRRDVSLETKTYFDNKETENVADVWNDFLTTY